MPHGRILYLESSEMLAIFLICRIPLVCPCMIIITEGSNYFLHRNLYGHSFIAHLGICSAVAPSDAVSLVDLGVEESSTVDFVVTRSQIEASSSTNQESRKVGGSESRQAKGPLPDGFFDEEIRASEQSEQMTQPFKRVGAPEAKQVKGVLPEGFFDDGNARNEKISGQPSQPSKLTDVSEVKQARGALPEGFFDNKDADLRARGIQPVKVDIR